MSKIEFLEDDDLKALIDDDLVRAHRERGLSPENPVVRGTSQNPDAFFQSREAINGFYDACPGHVVDAMKRFGERTGRIYTPFDYVEIGRAHV